MKQASNWLMTTHSVILWLKMTMPHGNGGNAMQALTYWLLKDSLSLSLYLWATTWHQRGGTVSLPLSAAASICWAKTSACEVFLAKAKQAEPRMQKKKDNNKKIRQAEEVEDKMVSKNLPKFMKVKLKGSKYEYIFQFFNMYFCITFMPTNTSSTNKMCRLAGFFVLLCWNEPWRHITCLHHKWGNEQVGEEL